MKTFRKNLFLAVFFISVVPSMASDKGYNISIEVKGIKDTVCYLANYYGDKQYLQDTGKVDANGRFTFEGKEELPGGIYLVVLPDKKYFEIIVDKEQHFSVETDTTNFVKNMKVKKSFENELFYNTMNYFEQKKKEIEPFRERLKANKDNKDSTALLQKEVNRIDKEVKEYQQKFIKDNSQTFVAKIFKTNMELEIPEAPKLENGKTDSLFAFNFYKTHFFDNLDFSDERFLRTPIFHNKIKQYLDNLTVQHPDSINIAADFLAEKAKANKELFKYTVYYITNNYETSKMMGMDAIFVHMAEKYYMTGQAYWVDSTQLAKISQRAMQLKPILIGKRAPNLIMQDSSGNTHSLYNINAKYTVLYFWDHGCSHCKKETPKLADLYKKVKSKGVEVFAVGTETDADKWKEFIREHELKWINVYDPYRQNNFHKVYDIYSTPVVYLLDKDKIIQAKRLDVEQLEKLLENLLKEKEKGKEK